LNLLQCNNNINDNVYSDAIFHGKAIAKVEEEEEEIFILLFTQFT